MRKILTSLGLVVFAGAVVVSATGAFFSDTETSTGNVFAAGAIDLRIDNESYAIDCNIPQSEENPVPTCTGDLVANPSNSWALVDLTIEKFFDFVDLKPGDIGEDTISIHVGSNDAWVCAAAEITSDLDNTITEPEDETDLDDDNADATPDGDLDSGLQFAFWVDDGDNVLETDEYDGGAGIFLSGTLANMGAAGEIALADSDESILDVPGPIPGNTEFFIGKAWCFGNLTAAALDQDGETNDGPVDDTDLEGPDRLGTGVNCDGSGVGNIAQTDSVQGDITFYAEQARNNDAFQCTGAILDN